MVKSNTLSITVQTKVPSAPGIISVSISADKTTVYVNEPVTIYYNILLDTTITPDHVTYYQCTIDIYVNGSKTRTITQALYEGSDRVQGSFQLVFSSPGTYSVYIDANIVKKA